MQNSLKAAWIGIVEHGFFGWELLLLVVETALAEQLFFIFSYFN